MYGKCGQLLETYVHIWQLLANIGNLFMVTWKLLANVGNFWKLVAAFGKCWQLLKTYGNFWQLMANFFWHTPDHFYRPLVFSKYPPKCGKTHLRNHFWPLKSGFSAIATYKTYVFSKSPHSPIFLFFSHNPSILGIKEIPSFSRSVTDTLGWIWSGRGVQ